MNLVNITVLLDFLIRLTAQAGQIAVLINNARQAGRDVSKEELDTLFNADDAARKELEAAIAAATARQSAREATDAPGTGG